jgi:hypothetical protein
MRRPLSKRTCQHCQTFFDPPPRSAGRQRDGSQPKCHQASKAARQRRGLQQPANRAYCTGPTQVERVRQWRTAHPGYWRPPGSRAPHAFQDAFTPQETQKQQFDDGWTPQAFQDAFFRHPPVLVGLIAPLTGLSFQEDIAPTARRLQQWGRAILYGAPHLTEGIQEAQTPSLIGQTPHRPPPVQLGGSAPGPGAL